MMAQIQTVSPEHVKDFLLIMIALVTVAGAAVGIIRKRRQIEPQPLEIKSVGDMVREKDCLLRHSAMESQIHELRQQRVTDMKDAGFSRKAIYGEIETLRKEMIDMERRLNAADEARTEKVHGRLNDLLTAVAAINERTTRTRS